MKINKKIFKVYNQVKVNLIKNKYYKKSDIIACIKILKNNQKIASRNFLKNNNTKLNVNVFSFDMPSGITCNSTCKGCYAIKNERIMPTVRISRLVNYIAVLYALLDVEFNEVLTNKIQYELDYIKLIYKNPVIRLHTSGDFFEPEYLNFWIKIINKNKDISFYSYTKMSWLLNNIDDINKKYKNFNIIKSFIKIDNVNYINYGDVEYINKVVNKCEEKGMPYYVCDYNKNNIRQAHACMSKCTKCLTCGNILFYKH